MTTPVLPTLERRRELGRGYRQQASRGSLAALAARPDDYDPIARLVWQGESRMARLLPLRYQRMLASPLAFFRGADLLMGEDLARGSSTSLEVQICGDAHLANFGVFLSPEQRMVFDVNDFDETDRGPFEWDIKRLVASLAIASDSLGHDEHLQETLVIACVSEYRTSIREFANETRLGTWYARLDVDSVMTELRGFFADHAMRQVDDVIGAVHAKDSSKAYARMITQTIEGPRITSEPPLITPLSELDGESLSVRDVLDHVLGGYIATLSRERQALLAQFVPIDAAHKVVGVGSVGTQCYVMLLVGRDQNDPFLLQIKEAQPSVVSLVRASSAAGSPGERVVEGQRLMQATPDDFLGWHSLTVGERERSFYVRQLYDNKASVVVEHLNESQLMAYGRVCAWVLARAHARSGRAGEIDGYMGKSESFSNAIASFALAYRQRNENDFKALARAAKEGRITVAE